MRRIIKNGIVYGGVPVWEGTQAEYDALLTKDSTTIYFISDGVFPPDSCNYSTIEHVVGTWVDGSTIYERSFSFNTTTFPTGWNWFSLNFTCNSIVTAEVNVKDLVTPYLYTQMPICVDNSNGKIGIYNNLGGYLGTTNGYITVRYTKTVT